MGNKATGCCDSAGDQATIDHRGSHNLAIKRDRNAFDIANELLEDGQVIAGHQSQRYEGRSQQLTGPVSPNSSSTQLSKKKEKVVLSFGEIAKQQKLAGHSTTEDEDMPEIERSRSNISGLNHESDSPRHRMASSLTADLKQPPEWPSSTRQSSKHALFNEELEQDGGEIMVFESGSTSKSQMNPSKPRDDDSQVSTSYAPSQLEKKGNLELVWQKANSINGIRKLNMNFKEERRAIGSPLDEEGQITRDYWQVCDQFLQMIDLKQAENLKMLLKNAHDQERITENIKSDINNYQHMAIGLGRRYPVPEDLDVNKAVKLQRQLMDRVIWIYSMNSREQNGDVYRLHKTCQCVADDEFVAQTGYEPEQIELFLFLNKQMVNDLRDRAVSYDYLQKNDDLDDDESQQSGSSRCSDMDDMMGHIEGEFNQQAPYNALNDVSLIVRDTRRLSTKVNFLTKDESAQPQSTANSQLRESASKPGSTQETRDPANEDLL